MNIQIITIVLQVIVTLSVIRSLFSLLALINLPVTSEKIAEDGTEKVSFRNFSYTRKPGQIIERAKVTVTYLEKILAERAFFGLSCMIFGFDVFLISYIAFQLRNADTLNVFQMIVFTFFALFISLQRNGDCHRNKMITLSLEAGFPESTPPKNLS